MDLTREANTNQQDTFGVVYIPFIWCHAYFWRGKCIYTIYFSKIHKQSTETISKLLNSVYFNIIYGAK